ncbi:MAG TPA: hypothetical protein ENK66_02380, partial [Arcobacter sp.]|nr:hypothetical protein [Arcobacter sp.]
YKGRTDSQYSNESDIDYDIYKKIIDIIKLKVTSSKLVSTQKKDFIVQLSCSMYKILSSKYNIEITIKDMKVNEVSHKKEILKFHYSSIISYSKYFDSNTQKRILTKHIKYLRKDLLISDIESSLLKYLYILGFESIIEEVPENKKLSLYTYLMLLNQDVIDITEFKLENIFSLISDAKFNVIMDTVKQCDNSLLMSIDRIDKNFFKEYNTFLLNNKGIPFLTYELDPPLSSGQKAILFIFSRIDNAIKQISSNNIIILLDEADLKLHLEWQRLFINDLITFLINNHKHKVFYIFYATHSPMILSDITDDRIVFLEKKENEKYSQELPKNRRKRTFGANIYDLYSDSFLVKDSIGAFTSNKINEIIEFFYKIQKATEEELDKLKEEYKENKERFIFIQNHIGEEFIRNIIENHIEDIEKKLESKTDKERRIEELKNELKRLEG